MVIKYLREIMWNIIYMYFGEIGIGVLKWCNIRLDYDMYLWTWKKGKRGVEYRLVNLIFYQLFNNSCE